MPAQTASKELPSWVLPVVVVVGILILIVLGWRALLGPSPGAPGAVRQVHPGMYDFRKEAQSGHLGGRARTNAAPTPP